MSISNRLRGESGAITLFEVLKKGYNVVDDRLWSMTPFLTLTQFFQISAFVGLEVEKVQHSEPRDQLPTWNSCKFAQDDTMNDTRFQPPVQNWRVMSQSTAKVHSNTSILEACEKSVDNSNIKKLLVHVPRNPKSGL